MLQEGLGIQPGFIMSRALIGLVPLILIVGSLLPVTRLIGSYYYYLSIRIRMSR